MRFTIFIIIIILNLILQVSFAESIEIFNVIPNTSIVLVISYAYLRDDIEGGLFGFILGIIEGIFLSGFLGLNALLYFLIGYFFGKFFKDLYTIYVIPVLFLVFIGTIFFESGIYITSFLFRARTNFSFYFINLMLPEAIYNVILTTPIYYILYFINTHIEKREKPYRKIFEKDVANEKQTSRNNKKS